ncbi:MAG: hypothetical protein ACRDJE_19540, partial [Dehalococcoidia bacterium]
RGKWMYVIPEAEIMIARLTHERHVKRAQRLAALAIPERWWFPAWLLRVAAPWRTRTASPVPPPAQPRARRHRTELAAVHPGGRAETARRLRRARRHESTPHHRAVKRRRPAGS